MTVNTIIEQVSRLGVELRAVDNRLQVRPSDVLPDDLRAALRRRRVEVVAVIEAEDRRAAAVDSSWERLRHVHARCGRPGDWLTDSVRSLDAAVEKAWIQARENASTDASFFDLLGQWEWAVAGAMQSAGHE